MSLRFVSRSVARAEFVDGRDAMRSFVDSRYGSLFPVKHTALETRVYTSETTTLVYTYYRHDLDTNVRITD
jgi:hypothetical protein